MPSKRFVVVCPYCKQVKTEEGWEKVPMPELIRITYGICPECQEKQDEEIE